MASRSKAVIRGIVQRLSPEGVRRFRAFRYRRRIRRLRPEALYRRRIRRLHPELLRRLDADSDASGDSDRDARTHVFRAAYRTGIWSSTGESLSGAGSELAQTEELRHALPDALRELGVRTLLDVPCGDWNWISRVELPVERYIGGELLPALVEENQARFGSARNEFRVIDLCADPLPAADLLLCRAALIHFSYTDIWRAIAIVLEADITFLATTSHPTTKENSDLPTGIEWRPLNHEAEPFRFPPPLRSLPDGAHGRRLAIWKVGELRSALRTRPQLSAVAREPVD